jgi:hypothetical protein
MVFHGRPTADGWTSCTVCMMSDSCGCRARAVQMDGYWGVNTTRALQQYLNSQIQAHLNKGTQQQGPHQSPMRTFVDDSKTAIGGAITQITGSSHSPSVAKVGQAAAAVASRSYRTSVPDSLSVDGAFSKRTISALQVPKHQTLNNQR